MALVCVYEGVGPTDAYLLEHWLREHNLEVRVRGQYSLGLQGAIPFQDVWPSLWVSPEKEEEAKALIKQFHGPREVRSPWRCPGCGESCEPTFDSCWKCGTVRPDDAPTV